MTESDRSLGNAGDTDVAWEAWGARDPYYGVLTNARYRAQDMTAEAKEEFFLSGALDVAHLFETIRRLGETDFVPRRVLDFGCGVGRLLVHFAGRAGMATGVDVAPSMLAEARRNCEARHLDNVEFIQSDDVLSALMGPFDLVHSHIVLQHISVPRGRALFGHLVRLLENGGWGAVHVTFAWDAFPDTFGQVPEPPPPAPPPRAWKQRIRKLWRASSAGGSEPGMPEGPATPSDPEMQMHFYNLSELMFMLQTSGVASVHVELTNHGGALGAFLIFRKLPHDAA